MYAFSHMPPYRSSPGDQLTCRCSAAQQTYVLKALSGLCAAIYQGFPTTIQQDRKLIQELQQQAQQQGGQQGSSANSPGADRPSLGQPEPDELRGMVVQYRLGLKLVLETALKAIIARSKGGCEAGVTSLQLQVLRFKL